MRTNYFQVAATFDPGREDYIQSSRWSQRSGYCSWGVLPPPPSWPCGHAGCHRSDGHAPVHLQWTAKGMEDSKEHSRHMSCANNNFIVGTCYEHVVPTVMVFWLGPYLHLLLGAVYYYNKKLCYRLCYCFAHESIGITWSFLVSDLSQLLPPPLPSLGGCAFDHSLWPPYWGSVRGQWRPQESQGEQQGGLWLPCLLCFQIWSRVLETRQRYHPSGNSTKHSTW